MSIRRKIEHRPILMNMEPPFVTYVRTKMFLKTRLKGIDDDLKVYISYEETERFFPYPKYNRKKEIEVLVNAGELKITTDIGKEGRTLYYYESLRSGAIDIRLIKPKPPSIDPILLTMKEYLKSVSLKPGSPSTLYFNAFLKFKERFIDVFFSVFGAGLKHCHLPV